MEYSMAVWTDRPQVLDRIDQVDPSDFRQRAEVVNVDVPLRHLPIPRSEAETADTACAAVGRDALPTGLRVALVGVHCDCADGSLNETGRRNLIGQCEPRSGDGCRSQCRAVVGLRIFASGRSCSGSSFGNREDLRK